MKQIEVDDDLYLYIASQTQHIGESASEILRRLLCVQQAKATPPELTTKKAESVAATPIQDASATPPVSVSMGSELSADFPAERIKQESSSTKRFLSLLSYLFQLDEQRFVRACDIKGKKRQYFSQSLDALLASGKTTKPQAIANTPYFVITNTNTQRKRYILQHVAADMGLSEEQVQQLCDII